jgi:hypothetical protein
MLLTKLLLMATVFLLGIYFAIRLVKRGLSKKYEPKAPTPWNSLTEGIDPTAKDDK